MELNVPNKSLNNRRKCPVLNCPNVKHNPNLNYFSFPLNETRARIWLTLCGNPALNETTFKRIRTKYAICSMHFAREQFTNDLRKKLVSNEIPTLLLPPGLEDFIREYDKNEFATRIRMKRNLFEVDDKAERGEAASLRLERLIEEQIKAEERIKQAEDAKATESLISLLAETVPKKRVQEEMFQLPVKLPNLMVAEATQSNYIFESVRVSTKKGWMPICRLCLKETYYPKRFRDVNPKFGKTFSEIIQLIFPRIDMNLYCDPLICKSCAELVSNSYQLRRTWEYSENILEQYKKNLLFGKEENSIIDHDYAKNTKLQQEEVQNCGYPRRREATARKLSYWGKAPFLCNQCGKVCGTRNAFAAHLSNVHGKLRHRRICRICLKLFKDTKSFGKHIKLCVLKERRKCWICGEKMKQSAYLHKLEHRKVLWRKFCMICDRRFPVQSLLRRHLSEVHGESVMNCILGANGNREKCYYWCNVCKRGFRKRSELVKHFRRKHIVKIGLEF